MCTKPYYSSNSSKMRQFVHRPNAVLFSRCTTSYTMRNLCLLFDQKQPTGFIVHLRNFEYCVWRAVSSNSSHYPQEVFLAQFSLYVHKCGVKPHSFLFILHQQRLFPKHNLWFYIFQASTSIICQSTLRWHHNAP